MDDAPPDPTPATIEQVAGLFGVPLPPAAHEQVARVLAVLLDSARPLDGVDLEDAEPAGAFDPRWEA